MNEPLRNKLNMHEPSNYLNRKVGDKITSEEARRIMQAGGECKQENVDTMTFNGERYVYADSENSAYFFECYLTDPWYIVKLPPESVPTAEELLEEMYEITGAISCWSIPYLTGINMYKTRDKVMAWREKVSKFKEG